MSDTRAENLAAGAGPAGHLLEQQLVARCQNGDSRACERLLDGYEDLVYGLVRAMGGDKEWVEDTVAECLYQICRSIDRFRGTSSFRTWIHGVTIRVSQAQRRKARRQKARAEKSERWSLSAANPAATAVDRVTHEQALDAVARLPEKYRVAVVLRYVGECDYKEVAAVLGIPVGTAKRRVFQGLQRIRRMFPETAGEGVA